MCRLSASGLRPSDPYSTGRAFDAWSQMTRAPASSGPATVSTGENAGSAGLRLTRAIWSIVGSCRSGKARLWTLTPASRTKSSTDEYSLGCNRQRRRHAARRSRRARRWRGRDGHFADFCPARRRWPFHQRLLARFSRAAAALRLDAPRRRAGRAGRAAFQSNGSVGAGFCWRPLLLASGDRPHERRQRDLLRHDRANLGRAVRLAPLPPAGDRRRSCRARPLPRRRGGAARSDFRAQAGRGGRRRLRDRHRRLLRSLLPRRPGGARDGFRGAAHLRSDADQRRDPVRRRARRRALDAAAHDPRRRGAHGDGVDQPLRRAGAIVDRARAAAGSVFLPRHLSRGDRRGRVRLSYPGRAGDLGAGARRPRHPRGHLCRPPQMTADQPAIVTPPSTTIACPVMKEPAFEARNTAAPAISSGSPMRRSGVVAVTAFSVSAFSHKARAKSVLTRPGAMQLTRTLCGPNSTARLRASWKSAALEML